MSTEPAAPWRRTLTSGLRWAQPCTYERDPCKSVAIPSTLRPTYDYMTDIRMRPRAVNWQKQT